MGLLHKTRGGLYLNNMKFLLIKNKIIGGVLTYLLVWLLLVSVDSTIHAARVSHLDNKDYEYWAKYLSVEPARLTFTSEEELQFISTVQHNKPTGFAWNDILFCDLDSNKDYTYFTNYQSSRTRTDVTEPRLAITPWFYGDNSTKLPPPGAECYILSEITYTPEELLITERPTRLQTIRSKNTFKIMLPLINDAATVEP